MNSHQSENLKRAKAFYYDLKLAEAFPLFQNFFEGKTIEACCLEDSFSLWIRTLYELGEEEALKNYRDQLQNVPEKIRTPELNYQLALSLLTQEGCTVEDAKKCFEKILFQTKDIDLLARTKMGLATCHDILSGDWKICDSIIQSIQEDTLDPYLLDLVGVWKAKILRDSGDLEGAERAVGILLAKIKSHFHWHAYLSAKVILGGVYFRQNAFDRLLEIIKEVRGYCDQVPLRTIKRQIDHLAEQMRGQQAAEPIVLERSMSSSVLRYQDKTLHLSGDKPWQQLLMVLIREKVLPKKDIIQKLYQRSYRPKTDDKLIYGQLHLLKRNLLKLGLSQKLITKESRGYRWIAQVSEVEEGAS
ncbi:hypothetical protein EBQ90_01950 [bacterium]|nr:hypothetical protein [bacterium]